MPFKRISKDKFKSPSGREYTESQVKLYYSLGGKFPGQDRKDKREKKK